MLKSGEQGLALGSVPLGVGFCDTAMLADLVILVGLSVHSDLLRPARQLVHHPGVAATEARV